MQREVMMEEIVDNPHPPIIGLLSLIFIVLWLFSVACLIWAGIDIPKLLKPEGTIKRGVKILSRPLRPEVKQFLLSLTSDIIERRKSLFRERISGFIRVNDNEAVIVYRDKWFPSSFIYIGYADLRLPEPVLEIRTSLPILLFLIPFVVWIVFIPFLIVMVGLGYYIESKLFDGFLNRKIEEHKLKITIDLLGK
jgi:hypothetical protein